MDITPLLNTNGNAASVLADAPAQKTLNQDDFLKLLVTQMSSQDPLNPQTDTNFVAQMAQFSALEQSKTMSSDISGLRADQQMLQANSLIGRTVTLNLDDGTQTSGPVSAVQVSAGTPSIIVNGKPYDLGMLSSISPTPIAN